MRQKALAISIALIYSSVFALNSPLAQAQVSSKSASATKLKPSELSLEQLYRAQPYAGKAATQLRFSNDGRYLAYAWNPFGEEGSDLYLHDTETGKTSRITSPAVMKTYDAPEDWDRFEKKLKQKEKWPQSFQMIAASSAGPERG